MAEKELFGNSEQLESSSCGHEKDHVADPNKMVGDLISRAAAIDAMRNEKTVETSVAGYASNAGVDWCIDAIKALPSAQPVAKDTNVPVKDCISRQAALDALDRLEYTPGEWATNGLTMCKDAIKALPSAQPGWIPVTERLPERNGYYLVTGRQGAVNKRLYQDGYWYGNWTVFAWMPLPKPWEGGKDGTD